MPTITLTTAGNNNVVVPAGVTTLDFVIVQAGGGGGGGASTTSSSTGGGGGGGEIAIEANVAVTPGTYVAVVGAGGTTSNNANGVAGGSSSFPGDAVTVLAHGGGFGSVSSTSGAAGLGGTGSTNTTHFDGGAGAPGFASGHGGGGGGSAGSTSAGGTATSATGGTAGTGSPTGAAGGTGASFGSNNGGAGGSPGAGGGGARGGAAKSGGTGSDGQIIIIYTTPTASGTSTLGGQGTLSVQATQQGTATLAATSSMTSPQAIQKSPVTLAGQGTVAATGNAFTGNFFSATGSLTAKATQGVRPTLGGAGVLTAQAVQIAKATLAATSSMSGSHTQTNIGAVGSLTAVASVTGRISSSTSVTWATCNAVRSASLLCTWDTQKRKTKTEQAQWRVVQRRPSNRAFAFRVRQRVVSTSPSSRFKDYGRVAKPAASCTWNTRSRRAKTVRCSWQTEQRRLANTAAINWNVLTNFSLLSSHAVFRWDDAVRLNKNATSWFNTLTGNPRVAKTGQTFAWNTPERSPATKQITWNTRGSVRINSKAVCGWRTRKTVARTGNASAWNVRLRRTTTGRSVAWDDYQRRLKLQRATWNTVTRKSAPAAKLSRWDADTRTSSTKSVRFSTTKRFSKTTASLCTWNTRSRVAKPAVSRWNDYVRKHETHLTGTRVFSIFSNAIIVIPGIQWETRKRLSSTSLACKFNTRNRRSKTGGLIEWDITPHVTKTVQSFTWNTRQRPHKIQSCTFREAQRVFKPPVHSSWLVLGGAGKTATIEWNVGGGVQGNIRRMSRQPWQSAT